jgi:ATP phosphoribosyltransferase
MGCADIILDLVSTGGHCNSTFETAHLTDVTVCSGIAVDIILDLVSTGGPAL